MRALILAYYFPPIGGGGVQRSLKFARYLPAFGYDVMVVTGPGSTVDRWSPADETLLSEADGIDVRRVSGKEPIGTPWQSRQEKWFGHSPPWTRWWEDGVVQVARTMAGGAHVIIASVPPYQTIRPAVGLAREFGCPWIADLRDHWALDELMIYATALQRRQDLRRMRKLLSTAAAILTVSDEGAKRIVDRFPEIGDRPVVSIPNGFDRRDFEDTAVARRQDGVFRIVHAGSLYTDHGLRQRWKLRRLLAGSMPGVDILSFSPIYLLRAIERLIERNPGLESRIELVLVGVVADTDRRLAERSRVVKIVGYVPHREAVAFMKSADLLFLPMYNVAPGMRAATVPGKAYEYLAAQRPILAAVPEGDARDILSVAGNVYFCAPDDVEAMAASIEKQLSANGVSGTVPGELLDRFERQRLTRELAAVLDAVTGSTRLGQSARS